MYSAHVEIAYIANFRWKGTLGENNAYNRINETGGIY
jgi:hypothetical protein